MVQLGRSGRPVPPELRQQHQDLLRRIQNLRARLQGGDPKFRTGEEWGVNPKNPPGVPQNSSMNFGVFWGFFSVVSRVFLTFFKSTRSTWRGT